MKFFPGVILFLSAIAVPHLALGQTFRQTSADDYTRYELLLPESESFRIIYDVTATAGGATYYFNGIRRGSEPTVHGVYDLMTGDSLPWEIVDGTRAQAMGMENASADGQYIQVALPRPVPEGGEVRLRIDKTYRDGRSYKTDGDEIIFDRTLGIKRNSVVLPLGYELVGVNYPSQVTLEEDGRIKVSFFNRGPAGVPYFVRARPFPNGAPQPIRTTAPDEFADGSATATTTVSSQARVGYTYSERAFQDREIVYFLQQPETHSFDLYHDYTENREGMDRYLNVVRAGSRASNPSAIILDTGEELTVETLRGSEITERGVDIGGEVTRETEVVVIWYDPVPAGHSVRLRITETYTDPNRYLLVGEELVWDRSFGRPQNTVILPEGWYLTHSSVPAVVSLYEDGRVKLDFVNDRQGNIDVFLKARRLGG